MKSLQTLLHTPYTPYAYTPLLPLLPDFSDTIFGKYPIYIYLV